ncbi:iron-hydroxamate ABC transporter substrate-binding protein [Peribacillus cavernae]|uniref:Iron-hydroxamate ABC transporter substrate-binding protein n=1 Tax=Peribacillus cavernae TaxID=1674310 RepID=A0A3S0U9F4_9BACI|nr:iron-hydroxamate ABC transporter substrate-binding protein [Peribacillus cavernae]MDQ0220827.1 iron complex transport system substrate-binding protein [Peribacillus cavernae]RUQ24836.1 iron-hydroxamate ABC transporter substrate-binding protein [Peribacillus cavernae]
MDRYKKHFFLSIIAVLLVGLLAACGSGNSEITNASTKSDSSFKTRTYHSENGEIEVPANPKRIAVLAATYAGNLLALGNTPIAVNEYPKTNKFYEGKLDGAEVITVDSLEKLLALEPDLIITYSDDKNVKKYSEIAPTVSLTYEKYSYLEQHIEIGKIIGKEKEAKAWVDEWQEKAKVEKEKVQKVIGKDATAMVFETYGKDIYVYGKNWGRGTEVIYQSLGLKAPEKVNQEVFGPGYKAISSEVIPQYAGDYIFVGDGAATTDNSFMKTDVWKGIPAVQKNNVITFESESFYFNDPISLEKEMEFIVDALTKGK